ncbi:MAG: 2-C-methyl-D-erythritol 4-phosphate cytidylyltransferase [Lachnospiraceae bacterium]|nr:2-C-methyl-D-erythritol 4-phosphate cytidylyltransferase [Lachnospiraceae bacterium]
MGKDMKNVAIVLAGGSGSRMKCNIRKQYLLLGDYPVLWYSLHAFQNYPLIDEIVLVCGAGEVEQCRDQFVEQYGFSKIKTVTEGGRERYHSVYEGLKAIENCDYVLIHDGARPFIDEEILNRVFDALLELPACAVGMPVKDTIKMSDSGGFVERTLPREKLWMIQTPQSFSYAVIRQAYDELFRRGTPEVSVTDDAMVAEYVLNCPVKLVEGSYGNIKITTPEDLYLAESLLASYKSKNLRAYMDHTGKNGMRTV